MCLLLSLSHQYYFYGSFLCYVVKFLATSTLRIHNINGLFDPKWLQKRAWQIKKTLHSHFKCLTYSYIASGQKHTTYVACKNIRKKNRQLRLCQENACCTEEKYTMSQKVGNWKFFLPFHDSWCCFKGYAPNPSLLTQITFFDFPSAKSVFWIVGFSLFVCLRENLT